MLKSKPGYKQTRLRFYFPLNNLKKKKYSWATGDIFDVKIQTTMYNFKILSGEFGGSGFKQKSPAQLSSPEGVVHLSWFASVL